MQIDGIGVFGQHLSGIFGCSNICVGLKSAGDVASIIHYLFTVRENSNLQQRNEKKNRHAIKVLLSSQTPGPSNQLRQTAPKALQLLESVVCERCTQTESTSSHRHNQSTEGTCLYALVKRRRTTGAIKLMFF